MDSHIKKWLYRVLILLLFLICCWILSFLWPYVKPVAAGVWLAVVPLLLSLLLAYLLLPFVHLLMKGKCSNRLAVWIVFIVLLALTGALFQWGIPALIREGRHFLEHLPVLAAQLASWNHIFDGWLSKMPVPISEMIKNSIEAFEVRAEKRAEAMLSGVDHSFKWIIALSLVPFMTFYLLKDRRIIGDAIVRMFPERKSKQVVLVASEINKRLGAYIRGQLWLSAAVAVFSFFLLFFIGLPYALPLSLLLGLFNIIPYIGPILGALPAVLIASTISVKMVIWVLVAAFGIQMVESHLLAPWIMGKNVHIHPVIIMLLLLVGGELAGMLGMIAVVPVYMIAAIILKAVRGWGSQAAIDK
ncbi:AI-2E family transporter [Jeotgalibacillus proteolyticus]|uniref:AI-2E family transporter n=1 Tax=Jeotgalibacillus proteolyticus TaxID=2082395 RepID=A0A2S5GF05_9BACL|nr:AI-2E family transporter [Jeotgalibacillus proteolyticus]PPA71501.1 hypothetical protein C4B60_05410 [Jeotgalibacillus proteolyticus]